MYENGDEEDEWVKQLAEKIADSARREYYMHYLHRLRYLSSPSEKLTFLYLALFQPQTLRTIRRGLNIHENTAIKSLRGLIEKNQIQKDDEHLYWVKFTD